MASGNFHFCSLHTSGMYSIAQVPAVAREHSNGVCEVGCNQKASDFFRRATIKNRAFSLHHEPFKPRTTVF